MESPKIDNNTQRKVMRYLDGEMPPRETAVFEARLHREPELAARLQELARLDRLVRQTLGEEVSLPVRRVSPGRWCRWIAAVFVAAAASLSVALMLPRSPGPEVEGIASRPPVGTQPAVAAVKSPDPAGPEEAKLNAPETYEAHFGQVWGLYDSQKMEIYLFKKTDSIQVRSQVELTGL